MQLTGAVNEEMPLNMPTKLISVACHNRKFHWLFAKSQMLFVMKVSRLGMGNFSQCQEWTTENSAIYLGLLKTATFGDIILFIGQTS